MTNQICKESPSAHPISGKLNCLREQVTLKRLIKQAYRQREIAAIFRMPPHKIGDLTKATFSNIEQQSIEYGTDTLSPWCERWEASIECNLLGPDTDLEVEFDLRSLMRGDAASRAAYFTQGINGGF